MSFLTVGLFPLRFERGGQGRGLQLRPPLTPSRNGGEKSLARLRVKQLQHVVEAADGHLLANQFTARESIVPFVAEDELRPACSRPTS